MEYLSEEYYNALTAMLEAGFNPYFNGIPFGR